MGYLVAKVLITAVLVAIISEIGRRSTLVGGVLASLPLVSILALLWLYLDTRDVALVAAQTRAIFWLILPSLAFFLVLPIALQRGLAFFPSLGLAMGVTLVSYWLTILLLGRLGIRL